MSYRRKFFLTCLAAVAFFVMVFQVSVQPRHGPTWWSWTRCAPCGARPMCAPARACTAIHRYGLSRLERPGAGLSERIRRGGRGQYGRARLDELPDAVLIRFFLPYQAGRMPTYRPRGVSCCPISA